MNYTHFDLQDMQPLFTLLKRCETIQQSLEHHPEGNVLNHSLQTFKSALRVSEDRDLLLAALLQDIGTCEDSRGHEKIACAWLLPHCSVKTLWLIQTPYAYMGIPSRQHETAREGILFRWSSLVARINTVG